MLRGRKEEEEGRRRVFVPLIGLFSRVREAEVIKLSSGGGKLARGELL